MPYVDRTVFTSNDQSSGEVADPNLLESNDKHVADVVDSNYTEFKDYVNGKKIDSLGFKNVKDYGAKGDGVSDDTTEIQNAINEASVDGSNVYFPPGKYVIGELNLKPYVSMIGVNSTGGKPKTFGDTDNDYRSWLYCTSENSPAIIMSHTTKIQNMNFYYPNQSTTSPPVVYPATIKTKDNNPRQSIVNCFFKNAYYAINAEDSHAYLYIQNVRGSAIKRGVFVGESYDIDRIEDVHFNTNNWTESDDTMKTWIQENGIAFEVGRVDWARFFDIFAFGYSEGFVVREQLAGSVGEVLLEGSGFDMCLKPINIVQSGYGVKISNTSLVAQHRFDNSVTCNAVLVDFEGDVFIEGVRIWGTTGEGIYASKCNNLHLSNIFIDDYGSSLAGDGAGVHLNNVTRGSLNQVIINGKSRSNTRGVWLSNCQNVTISGTQVYDTTLQGVLLSTDSLDFIVSGNILKNTGGIANNSSGTNNIVNDNIVI